jgi:hypothetical protein
VIRLGGGSLHICGECISTTAEDDPASAVEAICVSPSGTSKLQNVRQLTAMALNCIVSGLGADCQGLSRECGNDYRAQLFSDCNNVCQGRAPTHDTTRTNASCRTEIDRFNNGQTPKGEVLEDNCHEQPLVGTVGGRSFDFDPPGPAGSTGACNFAHKNDCLVVPPGEDHCASDDSCICSADVDCARNEICLPTPPAGRCVED